MEERKSTVDLGKNSSLALPPLWKFFPLLHSTPFLSTVAHSDFPIWLWLVSHPLSPPSLQLCLPLPLLSSSPAARNFSIWSPACASLHSLTPVKQTWLPDGVFFWETLCVSVNRVVTFSPPWSLFSTSNSHDGNCSWINSSKWVHLKQMFLQIIYAFFKI